MSLSLLRYFSPGLPQIPPNMERLSAGEYRSSVPNWIAIVSLFLQDGITVLPLKEMVPSLAGGRIIMVTPPDGNDFVAIAAGHSHSLAIKRDGSVVGWGDNGYGEATPPEGNDFIAISALVGGVYGTRAVRFLKEAKDKSKALQEIIQGNELFKKQNPQSADTFKQAQTLQSTETRKIVAEIKS